MTSMKRYVKKGKLKTRVAVWACLWIPLMDLPELDIFVVHVSKSPAFRENITYIT